MGDFHTAVALIVATDTEETAVRHMYEWTQRTFAEDGQPYYEACFFRGSEEHRVVYARQGEMGMVAAAVLTTKLIGRYSPRYVIMVGIAAGIAKPDMAEQIYGDVNVANLVWNYSVGKFVPIERADIQYGSVGFIPRPTMIHISEDILPYVEAATASPENQCHVHIGPMACGTSVVANRDVLEKQVRSQMQGTVALDMESYAVAYAAEHAVEPRPVPLIIKSVCDYADAQKSDQYQKFAAFTSCEYAKLLYEKFLPL